MEIYCCGCENKKERRLTYGAKIYPGKKDLADLPFWICDDCGNHVGCHHKSKNKTDPIGTIPTKEIRSLRIRVNDVIDLICKNAKNPREQRKKIYAWISSGIGDKFHVGKIESKHEADHALYQIKKYLE